MSFSYSIESCLDKIFYYVRAVALEDIKINFKEKGKEKELFYPKYDVIKFGQSFFRSFPCKICGKCCKDFLNIFFESEYSKNEWKSNESINVNGINIPIFVKEYDKKNDKCRFMVPDDEGIVRFCSIHNSYGITCHAPHRAPKVINNICNWTKRAYGRQWIKKPEDRCLSSPENEYVIEEMNGDISFFIHLEEVCVDLGIKNNCNDLENMIRNLKYKKENEKKEVNMF